MAAEIKLAGRTPRRLSVLLRYVKRAACVICARESNEDALQKRTRLSSSFVLVGVVSWSVGFKPMNRLNKRATCERD
jgi:hypothetical protein